jgi:hypothetical protein
MHSSKEPPLCSVHASLIHGLSRADAHRALSRLGWQWRETKTRVIEPAKSAETGEFEFVDHLPSWDLESVNYYTMTGHPGEKPWLPFPQAIFCGRGSRPVFGRLDCRGGNVYSLQPICRSRSCILSRDADCLVDCKCLPRHQTYSI